MERRDFLLLASTSALISSIGLNISCSRSAGSDTSGKEADLDKLIPQLLKETKTPGAFARHYQGWEDDI